MGYRDFAWALTVMTGQSVAADADSTYYIDTELTNPRIDLGLPAAVIVNVMTAPGAGTTGIDVELVHKISEPTTNDAFLARYRMPIANIVAGAEFVFPFPRGVTVLRYVRIYWQLVTGDEITGVYAASIIQLPV